MLPFSRAKKKMCLKKRNLGLVIKNYHIFYLFFVGNPTTKRGPSQVYILLLSRCKRDRNLSALLPSALKHCEEKSQSFHSSDTCENT